MLDPVALKDLGPTIIPVNRARHGDCALRIEQAASIHLLDFQMISNPLELLSCHFEYRAAVD